MRDRIPAAFASARARVRLAQRGSATVSQLLEGRDDLDERTVRALAEINRAFYRDASAEFGATREAPWAGWERLLPRIEALRAADDFTVLDVGCGNGRFAAFLDARGAACRYLGVDASAPLIEDARARRLACVDARFETRDFLPPADLAALPPGPFGLITLFGVLHHVPGAAQRRALLARLGTALRPGGLLALTAWQFAAFRRFRARVQPWDEYNRGAAEPVDEGQLDRGDHLLRWGDGDPPRVRYCHFADDSELDGLLEALPLTCEDRYAADGRGGKLNRYLVLRATP